MSGGPGARRAQAGWEAPGWGPGRRHLQGDLWSLRLGAAVLASSGQQGQDWVWLFHLPVGGGAQDPWVARAWGGGGQQVHRPPKLVPSPSCFLDLGCCKGGLRRLCPLRHFPHKLSGSTVALGCRRPRRCLLLLLLLLPLPLPLLLSLLSKLCPKRGA